MNQQQEIPTSLISHSNIVAQFWVNGNVPSAKNHKMWTGKSLIASKATMQWRRESEQDWIDQMIAFVEYVYELEMPLYIELTFYRFNKTRFDLINMAQGVFDQMQKYNWITDDDSRTLVPYFGETVYAPNNPGVIITVLKQKPEHYDFSSHPSGS